MVFELKRKLMKIGGRHRFIVAMWIVGAIFAVGQESIEAGSIRLRKQATVETTEVRLSDVAVLSGEDTKVFADVVVGQASSVSQISIKHTTVRAALDRQGVNWARISISGFEVCGVTVQPGSQGTEEDVDAPQGVTNEHVASEKQDGPRGASKGSKQLASNLAGQVDLQSQVTLKEHITNWLETLVGARVSAGQIKVEFDKRDQADLNARVWQDRFVISAGGKSRIGRLLLVVERYRSNQLVETKRFMVTVSKRMLAVVAVKAIRRGETVQAGDVEIREVTIDKPGDEAIVRLSDAVGKAAVSAISQGSTLNGDDVRLPLLVHRNEVFSVRVLSGGIAIKMYCKALEDGRKGQLIQVRNVEKVKSRESFVVRVVGQSSGLLVVNNGID
jgi:flagella basal body P-ring formation protein FlgA